MGIYSIHQYNYHYPPISSWVPMNELNREANAKNSGQNSKVDKVFAAKLKKYRREEDGLSTSRHMDIHI